MKKHKISLLLPTLILWAGCSQISEPHTGHAEAPVVYGEDDRLEVFEISDSRLHTIAVSSSVALMNPAVMGRVGDNIRLNAQSVGAGLNLCESEPFYDQPSAAFCSGTLIDDDLVLTAGHCISSQRDCEDTSFVFNYHYDGPDQLKTITADDVFRCRELMVRRYDPTDPSADFAIVRLSRSATPRFRPAAVTRSEGAIRVGGRVTLMGYSSGLPLKVDSGGVIRGISSNFATFRATTDAFGGDSGGGVFDSEGSLIGLLIGGAPDYNLDGACFRTSVQPNTGGGLGGEAILFARQAVDLLCELGYPSERLCRSSFERWTCDDELYAADDGCHCGCGTWDPDCDQPDVADDCGSNEYCRQAECVSLSSTPEPLPLPSSLPSAHEDDSEGSLFCAASSRPSSSVPLALIVALGALIVRRRQG